MPTVQIPVELSAELLYQAAEQLSAPDLERFAMRILALQARRFAATLPREEAELLLKIAQPAPLDVQERFQSLAAKRRAETLSPQEREELRNLTEKFEQRDAERVKLIAKYGQYRQSTFASLLEQL